LLRTWSQCCTTGRLWAINDRNQNQTHKGAKSRPQRTPSQISNPSPHRLPKRPSYLDPPAIKRFIVPYQTEAGTNINPTKNKRNNNTRIKERKRHTSAEGRCVPKKPVSPTRTQSEKTSASLPGAAQHVRTPPPQPVIERERENWAQTREDHRHSSSLHSTAGTSCGQTNLCPNRPTCTSKRRHTAQPDSSTPSQQLQLGSTHGKGSNAPQRFI
jgi:hypothetical protein